MVVAAAAMGATRAMRACDPRGADLRDDDDREDAGEGEDGELPGGVEAHRQPAGERDRRREQPGQRAGERAWSEQAVRSAQNIRVGPCTPVGVQL